MASNTFSCQMEKKDRFNMKILAGLGSHGEVYSDAAGLGVYTDHADSVFAIFYGGWDGVLHSLIDGFLKYGCEAGGGNTAIVGLDDMYL